MIKYKISKTEPYGNKSSFKYFLGYNDGDDDDNVIRPLCTKLPQVIGHVKYFDSNKLSLLRSMIIDC